MGLCPTPASAKASARQARLNSGYASRAIGSRADGCHAQLVIALLIFGLIVVVALLLAIEIRVRALLESTDDDSVDFRDPPERSFLDRAQK